MRPDYIFLCWIVLLAGAPNFGSAQIAGQPAKAKAGNAEAAVEMRRDVKIKVDAELNAAQLQILDQLRPLLKTQLDFAARACSLTDQQRKQLAEAGEETLNSLVTGTATLPGGAVLMRGGGAAVQRVVVREGNRARVVTMSMNSRAQFGSQVAALVHTNFPGEIEARYQEECAERSASQKRAVIDNTIVNIDKQLMLTEEQRKQIGEALTKAWNDANLPDLRVLISSSEYIPPMPDSCVTPYLRPAQQAVWKTRTSQAAVGGPVPAAAGFDPFAP